jgi:hypothetical protein
MDNQILKRILREAGAPDLLETLTQRLEPSDLQSLLLAVYRERAKAVSPATLLRQYRQNRFVQPAALDPRKLLELDRLAFSLLPPGFEPLELSPVCPLGTNSVVATVDQNNAVTTIRNTEVCSDSTNVMALECAVRRQALYAKGRVASQDIKLGASHRLLRPQSFHGPVSFAHFRIFSLCTAGRDRGSYRFETEALREHIAFYLRLFKETVRLGMSVGDISVALTAFDESRMDILRSKVIEALSPDYPDVRFDFDQTRASGRGYYTGAAFRIAARDSSGTEYGIVDGGLTDWTQQLLSNRKERLLMSGMGSERLVSLFGR